MRFAANTKHDSVIDVSKYTEMEIEHSHDTASRINQPRGVHADYHFIDDRFKDNLKQVDKDVRAKALNNTVSSKL